MPGHGGTKLMEGMQQHTSSLIFQTTLGNLTCGGSSNDPNTKF